MFATLREDPTTRSRKNLARKNRRTTPPNLQDSWKEKSSATALSQTKILTRNPTQRTSHRATNSQWRSRQGTSPRSSCESSFGKGPRCSHASMDDSMSTKTNSSTCTTKSDARSRVSPSSKEKSTTAGSSRNDHRSEATSPKEEGTRPRKESSSAGHCETK